MRRRNHVSLLFAALAGVFIAATVAGQSPTHRIYIPGAVSGPPSAATPPSDTPPADTPPAATPPAATATTTPRTAPPPAAPPPTAPPATTPLTATPRPIDDIITLINQRRRAAGCGEVRRDDTLAAAAQRHAEDMARNDFVSHTGSDGSNFGQRARQAGYAFSPSGEIIAAGYPTPAATVEGWINSSGHRNIMLDCANTDAGGALVESPGTRYRYYWTAVFGRRE